MIYSVRGEQDIMEKEVFDTLDKNNEKYHLEYIFSKEAPEGWTGPTGRVNKEYLEKKFGSFENKKVYICGPPPMITAAKEALLELGLKPENYHVDNWDYAKKVVSGEVK